MVRIVRRRRNEKKKCTGIRPNMGGGVYKFFCTLSYRTQYYVFSLRTDLLRVGRIRRSIVAGIYYTLLHESSASPVSVLCTLQLQLQQRSRCLYFLHGSYYGIKTFYILICVCIIYINIYGKIDYVMQYRVLLSIVCIFYVHKRVNTLNK